MTSRRRYAATLLSAAAANVDDGMALLDAAGRALADLLKEIDRLPADTLKAG